MMNKNTAGQTHDQLQADCYLKACQLYHPFIRSRLICIPNDMHAGNVVRWKQYEALGVTPGVWDMQLHWFNAVSVDDSSYETGQGWHIIPATHWFEFKVGNDKLSKTRIDKRTGKKIMGQEEFRDLMLPLGHKFYVVSETIQFLDHLKNIIEPTLHIAEKIWGRQKS